jgi:outer membrane protein assembly factor BamB
MYNLACVDSLPVMLDDHTVIVASANAYVYGIDVISGVPRFQRRVAVSEGRSDVQRLIDMMVIR